MQVNGTGVIRYDAQDAYVARTGTAASARRIVGSAASLAEAAARQGGHEVLRGFRAILSTAWERLYTTVSTIRDTILPRSGEAEDGDEEGGGEEEHDELRRHLRHRRLMSWDRRI